MLKTYRAQRGNKIRCMVSVQNITETFTIGSRITQSGKHRESTREKQPST